MKRVLGDGWFQMFAAVAGLSAAILAFDRLAPKRLPPEPPSAVRPAAAPAPVLPLSPPISRPVRAPIPAPAPIQAATSRSEAASRLSPESYVRAAPEDRVKSPADVPSSFPIFKIAPKTPGRWIVSNQEGPDVDSPSIARVIFSASDGDIVSIRPGMYLEPLEVTNKTLTFRGLGTRPEEVLLTSPDPSAVLKISHATVNLENVRVEPEKGYAAAAAAVRVASGRLTLRNVVARSQGAAIQASQGADDVSVVNAVSSRLDGAYADVLVRGKARVALRNSDFANARQPIVIWRDVSLTIDACRFPRDPKSRIFAYEESAVSVDASPTAPPVSRKRGDDDANADKSKFSPGRETFMQGRSAGFARDIFRRGRKTGDLN